MAHVPVGTAAGPRPPALLLECQRCLLRYRSDVYVPCPRCHGVVTTVLGGRLDQTPDPPRSRILVRRRLSMARAAVRSAASTDPDIEVEAEATPTAPAKGKTRVLKMAKQVKAAAMASTQEAPKAKAKNKPPKPSKDNAPSKFIGVTSGMRVAAFQNQLMARNFKARLTDEQLALAMRDEFPHAVAFTEKHVKGIRSQWNHGKRGNPVPDKPLPEYGEDRNPLIRNKGGAVAAKKVKAKAKAD